MANPVLDPLLTASSADPSEAVAETLRRALAAAQWIPRRPFDAAELRRIQMKSALLGSYGRVVATVPTPSAAMSLAGEPSGCRAAWLRAAGMLGPRPLTDTERE